MIHCLLNFSARLDFFSVRRIAVVRRVIRTGRNRERCFECRPIKFHVTYLCTRATHPIVLIWIFLRKSLLLQHTISTLDRERRCRWQSTKTIVDKNNYALVIYLRETSTLHFHLFLVILCFHQVLIHTREKIYCINWKSGRFNQKSTKQILTIKFIKHFS